MISYEAYKILHLITLFMLMAAMGIVVGEGRWIPSKKFKTMTGVFSFLAFVAGMGLIARLGFRHGEGFPAWIWIKMSCWVLLNIALVLLFKMQSKSAKLMLSVAAFCIVVTGIVAAVTKLG